MTPVARPPPPRPDTSSRHGVVLLAGLILLISLPEFILLTADWGLVGSPRWRPLAYQYGAFWAGLLHGWTPNYAAQPWAMFATYAFLHAGPAHLLGNMLGLVWLGRLLLDRLGGRALLALYMVSALTGAAAFGLLSRSPAPMVGASGAIFGLAGGWIVGELSARLQAGLSRRRALRPALQLIALLVGLNLATWVLQNGQLAWETHLGGFLGGAALASLLARHGKDR